MRPTAHKPRAPRLTPGDNERVRYRILGVTQTADDQGDAVPVPGARLRALLTALALRPGRLIAPETLIDEVWGDTPPQDAPAALQALIGRLRRAVGKDSVTSAPGGYRLAATEDDVDLFVFERLVCRGDEALGRGDAPTAARTLDDALALWRGPALADLPDRTAATRPEALRMEATRARAEADLLLGRAREAVPRLTELAAAHPYDEPLQALLIRALRDTGREADALAAYETARRTLADGLGTDPGPHLRALHTELLNRPEPDHGATTAHGTPPLHGTPPAHGPGPVAPPTPPHTPLRLPERTGNIRPRLTSFVGREPELDAIRSEVHRARLVTLTGPGGSGKTRLAEEAAAGLPQAWLAELAPLDRPEAVPGAVVSALGLRETVLMTTELASPQDDPVALLVEYCAPRSQLLILDNCEHVIGAAAALAETLLTRCPGLTILATSREPLGVPGESVRPVEPLLPDQAHRLFTERATAVRPDAAAALRDEEAIAEICRRLDGLPLAIELAAARLRLLTPRQIADRLDDRFRLLTSGSRTVLPRQQTLRAVVDWSWDLLDEPERTLLRELSVFAGGWDLEAAEAVCTGPVAELVGALVDKSLVVAAPCERGDGGGMRYRMLETIHEYATERAAELPGAARRPKAPPRVGARARRAGRPAAALRRATPLDLPPGDRTGQHPRGPPARAHLGRRGGGHRPLSRHGLVLVAAQLPPRGRRVERPGPAPRRRPGHPRGDRARSAVHRPRRPHRPHGRPGPRRRPARNTRRHGGDPPPARPADEPADAEPVPAVGVRAEGPRGGPALPGVPGPPARRLRAGRPQAARMPGLLWPLTAFQMRDMVDVRGSWTGPSPTAVSTAATGSSAAP